jgi:hypothetical protein
MLTEWMHRVIALYSCPCPVSGRPRVFYLKLPEDSRSAILVRIRLMEIDIGNWLYCSAACKAGRRHDWNPYLLHSFWNLQPPAETTDGKRRYIYVHFTSIVECEDEGTLTSKWGPSVLSLRRHMVFNDSTMVWWRFWIASKENKTKISCRAWIQEKAYLGAA